MVRTLASVAEHVHGELYGPDRRFDRISTDTRQNVRGSLFVALSGDNFDGNDYIEAAASGGAAGALVSRRADVPLSQVEVGDTRRAFGDMACAWRSNFEVPVVAVTGSAGKTTVRSLVAAILSVDRQICTTQGNLNNEIGVPITLMRMQRDDAAAVIELGANHAGEIDRLAAIARPSIAIITNAGAAHLEGFGSLDGVATAKGELLDHLDEDGTAILNADDVYFDQWRRRASPARVVSFGLGFDADCHPVNAVQLRRGSSHFTAHLPDGNHVEIDLPLPGEHNVRNALAAAACASVLGVGSLQIAAGLAASRPVEGRLGERVGIAGSRIVDDSYNANPSSARAALDYLAHLDGQRVFVLGDMGELGPDAVKLHREVGEYARSRCDRFVTVGALAAEAASAFGSDAQAFEDFQDVVDTLRDALDADTTVLIKASRSMKLERLAAALAQPEGGPSC